VRDNFIDGGGTPKNNKRGKSKMWKSGEINGYKYEMKQYDSGSVYGINEGRISKLSIRKDGKEMYNYDRGLDFDELDEGGKIAYAEIIEKHN
jgi:hypothetical protein